MISDDRRRAIGKVVSISADRLVVELHRGTESFTIVGFDDVRYVAHLGSFLMIPIKSEYVVAEIVGLREKDPSAGKESNNSSELDKATSAKYLDLVPVGMLPQKQDGRFTFGVSTYPSLYADALYALNTELDRIFEVDGNPEPVPGHMSATRFKALSIGKSVVFQEYDLKVKVDDFFGGHIAILGNTGSGKSCTVATILQALFEKPEAYKAHGATFIIFDVNGEYWESFKDLSSSQIGVRCLHLDGTAKHFCLPHWFLNIAEWELLLQASSKTQIPVLRNALGIAAFLSSENHQEERLKEHLVASCIKGCLAAPDSPTTHVQYGRIVSLLQKYPTNNLNQNWLTTNHHSHAVYKTFDNKEALLEALDTFIDVTLIIPTYNNTPFDFYDLEECIDLALLYEEAHGNRQIRDYCSSMLTRYKALCQKSEFEFLRNSNDLTITKSEFLQNILGLEVQNGTTIKDAQVIILNMNEVDDDVVKIVSAVLTRMIFQLLRQASPRNRFPVHLILEEAHRYIADKPSDFAIDANLIFERVAKEGRKYGLFLIVASQRPSELSKTVLSQCSNYIVQRIQNPEDLGHIRQMTPFISDAVLKRLPSLPKQHALVFGSAVNLPTTFRVRDCFPLPASTDTKIRELWFREASHPAEIVFNPT